MEVESHDEADHEPARGAIGSVFIKEEVEDEGPDEVSSQTEGGLGNSNSLYIYHAGLLAYFHITSRKKF